MSYTKDESAHSVTRVTRLGCRTCPQRAASPAEGVLLQRMSDLRAEHADTTDRARRLDSVGRHLESGMHWRRAHEAQVRLDELTGVYELLTAQAERREQQLPEARPVAARVAA